MPTHDYIISNGTGAAVRADINSGLQAIVSLNSNPTDPAAVPGIITYAYQLWADTTNNLLKIRNSANSAWITLRQLDGDFSIVAVEDGLQATPSLTFTNDLNTGIFRPGNDSLAIVTNALSAITITSTQAVGIQTPNPSTALHVAGNARVGADDVTDAHLQIGKGATGNRNSYIDIVGDTTYTDYGVRFIRNNTGANATSEIKHRGTGAFNIVTQEAAPIEFYTSNSPSLTITSGGLVGIGTSGPGGKLDVRDAGTTIPALGAVGTGLNIRRTDGSIGLIIGYENTIGGSYIQAQHTNGSAVAYPLYLQPNGGNVGIGGTTSPGSLLHLADAGHITVGSSTGTKIGTATTQKLGFYNATPVVQPIAVADATDAATAITQLNALLARMRDLGLIAT